MNVQENNDIHSKIAALLSLEKDIQIERLPTSGNNRLYLLNFENKLCVVKHYFKHKEDKRDRLNSEFSFLSFANKIGLDCLPQPIARDDLNGLGIYSYIKGLKPSSADVEKNAVSEALNFLAELNKYRYKSGEELPMASEACFSIEAHFNLVEKRIDRLFDIDDQKIRQFAEKELAAAWKEIKSEIISGAESKGIRCDKEISKKDRIISPSDFGFHNTIIGEQGKFYFIDFEYAGWDDPAKTIGDFFSQVALPVPVKYISQFVKKVADLTSCPNTTATRALLLLRLFRLKWCCIVLNHFVKMDSERRKFAGNDLKTTKEQQFLKAKKLLNSMNDLKWRLQ